MNGGEVVVQTLLSRQVDTVFFVSGGTYVTVLEALSRNQDRIRCVPTRLESSATFAAEAYAALARKPACVLVSRSPGATNAAIGIHTARQSSRPLVLIIGDIPRRFKGREAFQEIDYRSMYAPIAKAVFEVSAFDDVAAVVARALDVSVSARPGPVVVSIPTDVLDGDTGNPPIPPPPGPARAGPDPHAIEEAASLLDGAERPLIIAGELVGFERAHAPLVALAESSGAGVLAAYRQADVFPNDHPAWLGQLTLDRAPHIERALDECDLIAAIGTRFDSVTTGDYGLLRDHHRLIMVHPDSSVFSQWQPRVSIASNVLGAMEAMARACTSKPPPSRLSWCNALHRRESDFAAARPEKVHGRVDMRTVVDTFRARAAPDTIVVSDAGTFGRWLQRHYPHTLPDTSLGPVSGAMGYGLPGGIGASIAHGSRPVFVWVGDGGFLMTGHEAATIVQEGLPIKIVVCDNSAWGSILVGQQKRFTGWDFGTRLRSPDFATLARGYGMSAFSVSASAEFEPALDAAMNENGPALIHLELDPRDASPFG
ncbi:MAG: thiamine pyrophosphate-binding protein [Gammaproteobacteria bacterium]